MTAGHWQRQLAQWQQEGSFALLLPEVEALREVPQPPEFHPEGDAYIHTMLAIAAVADDDDERVFWGVLLHDIGKAATTCFHHGRLRAHGHAKDGAERVPTIMVRLGLGPLADDVQWLVRYHHYRLSWNQVPDIPLSSRQQRFTRLSLFPLLERVCVADAAGRGTSAAPAKLQTSGHI